MNYDIRSSVDSITDGMKHVPVGINEGDFISGDVELSDTQVKQLFMVLSQVLAYKKLQGTLQGYKPTFKIDKVELNELDPFGGISKASDTLRSKFGSKKSQMTQIARESAQKIWNKWDDESIGGSVSSTIENVGNWLKKEEFDLNLLDFVFRALGVPNIKRTLRTQPEDIILPLSQWMEENGIMRNGFTGNELKEYLLDVDVQEQDISGMLDDIGVKNLGTVISNNQITNIEKALKEYTPSIQDEPDIEEPIGDEEPTDVWPASKIYNYALNKYDTDSEKLKAAFEALGTSIDSEEPMGDEAFRRLMSALSDVPEKEKEAPQDTEAVMDKTQEILKGAGASVGQAKTAGQKAVNTGEYTGMTELQKLGIAILTARKKI